MIELNLLFVLLLLTALARYIVFDAFEPLMFAMIFLLPITSLVIFMLSKRLAEKERSYQPKGIEAWSFYNLQKTLMIQKPLFKGDVQRGYVKRYFPKKWNYVLGDIFGFNWYLSLEIQIDKDRYDVHWYREKWFNQQDQWEIYKNGERIGEARTLINLKNAVKLKEAIQFRFYEKSYISSATTVTSIISLTQDEQVIGTLKRNHIISNVQVIDVQEHQPEYIIALIVHSYYFKNR
ncbi:hypothetical protein M670_04990 [Schinkia azotoformans MEV2011]|uniref:Uncharacterized protein n=1 Tax=Schinkia azotoformans MEV2011 TaxID=1348973 RepID=A0A072NE66_SCHAZ|nr:hypothetical protein [Schinkia azotoformans]KEF35846.1 hypothetical protein M670_04990 [Schinkia azotoformans MEV2011]MEC1698309.1 hypothetical protein [Schinkia azotoformans]MEC1726006.1 hypothetical protein [Schinkia azotoformans]MEC1772732.1 hypothetical protein [Schinkia azotoformans]MEC1782323.1 hypothetical protein [Schinkia azotoformans]